MLERNSCRMACTGSGGKGTASVCKCMSNIRSTWNAYCHEIIITLTVTLLKVRTMTYMSWYVMICHVSCIQNDGMEENLPWYPSLPCVQMPSWSGWGEDTASVERRPCALTPVFGQLTIGPINSCWLPTYPQKYEDMSRIYETDLWRIQTPRKVLLFDFDSTELEVLLKGKALCNEIDVQFSQRWKDYEWNENWWNIMTAIMTLKSKFNLNNSNDHEHHYHHKYHPPLYQ